MTSKTIIAHLAVMPTQQAALDATLEAFTRASAEAMAVGRRAETTSNVVIHRLCYRELRAMFGLSANLTVRAIAHAARRLKKAGCTEEPRVVEYDRRTFSLSDNARLLSLSTVHGRVKGIRLHLDDEYRRRLQAERPILAVLRRSEPSRYVLTISLAPSRPSTSIAFLFCFL